MTCCSARHDVAVVRPKVIGERPRDDNRIRHPLNEAIELTRSDRWVDWSEDGSGPTGSPTANSTVEGAVRQRGWFFCPAMMRLAAREFLDAP